MLLSVIPKRRYCSFQNSLRKFPLLWRVDLRSLNLISKQEIWFGVSCVTLQNFCNTGQGIKVFWGVGFENSHIIAKRYTICSFKSAPEEIALNYEIVNKSSLFWTSDFPKHGTKGLPGSC